MLNKLPATKDEFSTTILRVILGVVMLPHGAQKLLGWFAGPGDCRWWALVAGPPICR